MSMIIRIRHGEVDLISTDEVADGDAETPRAGQLVIGHSESGHHHVIVSDSAKLLRKKGRELAMLILEKPADLVHLGDRHLTTTIPAGKYWIGEKRQASGESWSRVED